MIEGGSKMVSIIVPVFNAEKTIERCCESLENQIYKDYEIILIDDGSTDSSQLICKKFVTKNKKFTLISQKNTGALEARWNGLKKAKGEYVTFVDSDDWVSPYFLDSMIQILKKYQPDLIAMGCLRETQTNSIVKEFNKIKTGYYSGNSLLELYNKALHYDGFFEFGILPYLCTKMFCREKLIQNMADIDFSLFDGEDAAIIFPYIFECNSVYVGEECLYHYMYNSESISHNRGDDYYFNVAKLYLYMVEKFKKMGSLATIQSQLDQYMRMMVWQSKPECFIKAYEYLFPFEKVNKQSRIVLYGAGVVGQTYFHQIKKSGYCEIVGWADKRWKSMDSQFCMIAPENISSLKYDVVVIAVADKKVKNTIESELRALGVTNIL